MERIAAKRKESKDDSAIAKLQKHSQTDSNINSSNNDDNNSSNDSKKRKISDKLGGEEDTETKLPFQRPKVIRKEIPRVESSSATSSTKQKQFHDVRPQPVREYGQRGMPMIRPSADPAKPQQRSGIYSDTVIP